MATALPASQIHRSLADQARRWTAGAAAVAHLNAPCYLTPKDRAGCQDLPVFSCDSFRVAFLKRR